MTTNRRRYKRFSATAFLNKPVIIAPLLPYFGEPIEGKLIDLSAGGMSIYIDMVIPQGTNVHIEALFADRFKIDCDAQIKHVIPRNRSFLHGFEFLNLSVPVGERIQKMSMDYIDCETRIDNKMTEVCQSNCAFFSLCNKPERLNPVMETKFFLELAFKELDKSTLTQASR